MTHSEPRSLKILYRNEVNSIFKISLIFFLQSVPFAKNTC